MCTTLRFNTKIRLFIVEGVWMKTQKISFINLQQQDNKMSSYSRMFRGRIRMSTCRIILITSLAWLLIDVILIMKYTDGLNGGIFKKSRDNEVRPLLISITPYPLTTITCSLIYIIFSSLSIRALEFESESNLENLCSSTKTAFLTKCSDVNYSSHMPFVNYETS